MAAESRAARWGPADQAVARLLLVTPREPSTESAPSQLLGFAVLISGLRCILRYAVLPFGLPLLGVAAGTSLWITLAFDVVAVVAAISSVRRLWAVRHPQRWRYLLIACGVIAVSGMFLLLDTTAPPLRVAGL